MTEPSHHTMLWAEISVPLHVEQITVMASFCLYWSYCQNPQSVEEISKAKAVASYIKRICAKTPSLDDWVTVSSEQQRSVLIMFNQISSSGKHLKGAVGFFKEATNYNQIKSLYSQIANILLNESSNLSSVDDVNLGYFITLRSGAVEFSLFPKEAEKIELQELREQQEKEVRDAINVFKTDPCSRIRLAYILMTLASVKANKPTQPKQSSHILDLDDLDEEEVPDKIELLFTDELKCSLQEIAKRFLDLKTPFPKISPYCISRLNSVFSETTEEDRNNGEQMLLANTNNQFLLNYYQKRMQDTLSAELLERKNVSFSIPEELIVKVTQIAGVMRIGVFYYNGNLYFSEDTFFRDFFDGKIKEIMPIGQEIDYLKLKIFIQEYFIEMDGLSRSNDILAVIEAIDSKSDSDLAASFIEIVRQRPYLKALLYFPLPGLQRCKSILSLILNDSKYLRVQNQPFNLQEMQRFSHQGLIAYLQMYLDEFPALFLNIRGRITPISVFEALKASASLTTVYAPLSVREIALYATPDEAYGLIYQAASLIKAKKEDPSLVNIDSILVILTEIRNSFEVSLKKLSKLSSVTRQDFMRMFTEKLHSLTNKNDENVFKKNCSTILAGLQKVIQVSLSEKEKLSPNESQLLVNAQPKGLSNYPSVGWFVVDKTGEIVYTLNSQKALLRTRLLINSQEERSYNQPVNLVGFPIRFLDGDLRLLIATGLFALGKIKDTNYIIDYGVKIPAFSPLALKQWSKFILERGLRNFLANDASFHAKKDVLKIAQRVIENLPEVSSQWPQEIIKIQESLKTKVPYLLVFKDDIFYNEFDFWVVVWEQRLISAQSANEIYAIIEAMFPEDMDNLEPSSENGDSSMMDNMEALEILVPFLNRKSPTRNQIFDRVLKQHPSEIDFGWIYEQSKNFPPLFSLLIHLLRVYEVVLPMEINEFLQKGFTPETIEDHDSATSADAYLFQMEIDPRRIPITQRNIPPIYYNDTYRLSRKEMVSTYLNNLLNRRISYPYYSAFAKTDLFLVFLLGSIEAIQQILCLALCSPFPDFPERYPLAKQIGFKSSWEQMVDMMSIFVNVTDDHPELLAEFFVSCFPQDPPEQMEKIWSFYSFAVMIMMLVWAKSKKLSHEDQIIYAFAGLWHDLGMVDFGGAFDPNRGGLKGDENLFNEYLMHQKYGVDTFNSAWERWAPQDDVAQKYKKAISDVIQFHHVKPMNPLESSILQEISDIIAVAYIASSITNATLSVMYVHAKGAIFDVTLDRMLSKLSRSDSNKYHLPVKIMEIFPKFCTVIRSSFLRGQLKK